MSLENIQQRFGSRVFIGAHVMYQGREAMIRGASGDFLRIQMLGETDIELADPTHLVFLRGGDVNPEDFNIPDGSGDDVD